MDKETRCERCAVTRLEQDLQTAKGLLAERCFQLVIAQEQGFQLRMDQVTCEEFDGMFAAREELEKFRNERQQEMQQKAQHGK